MFAVVVGVNMRLSNRYGVLISSLFLQLVVLWPFLLSRRALTCRFGGSAGGVAFALLAFTATAWLPRLAVNPTLSTVATKPLSKAV